MKHFFFKRRVSVKAIPTDVREAFLAYDRGDREFGDSSLDLLIGLDVKEVENRFNYDVLNHRYGSEQFIYEGTPYSFIREFFRQFRPQQNDIVYDLGSGYGRLLFYGAFTTKASFKGIEIVAERVETCQRTQRNFNLRNITVIQGNVLEQNFSDGTIFFLFNPFGSQTLARVTQKMKMVAKIRKIRIASWGGPSERYLRNQDWLRELAPKQKKESYFLSGRLAFFESR